MPTPLRDKTIYPLVKNRIYDEFLNEERHNIVNIVEIEFKGEPILQVFYEYIASPFYRENNLVITRQELDPTMIQDNYINLGLF